MDNEEKLLMQLKNSTTKFSSNDIDRFLDCLAQVCDRRHRKLGMYLGNRIYDRGKFVGYVFCPLTSSGEVEFERSRYLMHDWLVEIIGDKMVRLRSCQIDANFFKLISQTIREAQEIVEVATARVASWEFKIGLCYYVEHGDVDCLEVTVDQSGTVRNISHESPKDRCTCGVNSSARATLQRFGWVLPKTQATFLNAQYSSKANSGMFTSPTTEALKEIQIGDSVKVCAGNEWFWTEVETVSPGLAYPDRPPLGYTIAGRVKQRLIFEGCHGFQLGDRIEFCMYDVFDIKANLKGSRRTLKYREETKK